MRSKIIVAAGTVRSNALSMRHTIVLAAVIVGGLWVAYGFAQEAYLGHKLSQQVSDLRRQNSVLAAQNAGYHKDIDAMTSGAADEEEARLNGYTKPWEKLYLVTEAPSPSPNASPGPTPAP